MEDSNRKPDLNGRNRKKWCRVCGEHTEMKQTDWIETEPIDPSEGEEGWREVFTCAECECDYSNGRFLPHEDR